jgi:hypothetical protein
MSSYRSANTPCEKYRTRPWAQIEAPPHPSTLHTLRTCVP